MVVVERRTLLETEIAPVAVIAIVLEYRDLLGAKAVDDAADHGRLPGPRPAGDADHEWRRMMHGSNDIREPLGLESSEKKPYDRDLAPYS
jgi:hypothetical protein